MVLKRNKLGAMKYSYNALQIHGRPEVEASLSSKISRKKAIHFVRKKCPAILS